jgi:hypothetical protein
MFGVSSGTAKMNPCVEAKNDLKQKKQYVCMYIMRKKVETKILLSLHFSRFYEFEIK